MSFTRYDFGIVLAMAFSFIVVIAGVICQLEKRKDQFICESNLRHWNSAFQIHYSLSHVWGVKEGETPEDWHRRILSYLEKTEVSRCPSALPSEDYSYKICHWLASPNLFRLPEARAMVIDSRSDGETFTKTENFWEEVDYRHLEGANLLMTNGSVVHRKISEEKK